eukprot:PhF_6_TR22314/c0_g1_i3/m.31584
MGSALSSPKRLRSSSCSRVNTLSNVHKLVDDVWSIIVLFSNLQSVNSLRLVRRQLNHVVIRTQPFGIHLLLSMHEKEEQDRVTRTSSCEDDDGTPSATVLWLTDLLGATSLQKQMYWPQLQNIRIFLTTIQSMRLYPSCYYHGNIILRNWHMHVTSPPNSGALRALMAAHPQDSNDAICLRCGSWFTDTHHGATVGGGECRYHPKCHHMAYGDYGDNADFWECCH